MHNHRYWVAASALALLLGSTGADATTLDKLTGQSLTVGNLLFSNIQAPNVSGIGPSAIDVQGVVTVDPLTGAQRTGLRFATSLAQSPSGGPHELTALFTCAIVPPTPGACSPSSGPLYPGFASYYVQNQVQMIIANRKQGFGTTTLQQFEVLYGE
jgi:hypothetical protein